MNRKQEIEGRRQKAESRKRSWSAFCLLPSAFYLLFPVSCLYAAQPDSALIRAQRGDIYASEQKWDEAISQYQAALKLNPNLATAHNGIGYVHWINGDLSRAIKHYQQAIKLDPKMTAAYIGLGRVYMTQASFEAAINEFSLAIKFEPKAYEAYCNRGVIYSRIGEYDKAIADLKKSLQIKSDYEPAMYDLGFLYQLQGKYEAAISIYQQVLKYNPDLATIHHNLARCYTRLGKLDEAAKESEIAKKLRVYADKVQQAQAAIQNSPEISEPYMALASIYEEYGELQKAEQQYMKVIKIAPTLMDAYGGLAAILIRRGELSRVVELYQQAVRIKPDHLMAYTMLGLIYKKLGQLNDSDKQLNIALELAKRAMDSEPTAEKLDDLAFVYLAKGLYAEAETALKKAVELDPQNEKYQQQLEQIRKAKGEGRNQKD